MLESEEASGSWGRVDWSLVMPRTAQDHHRQRYGC